MTTLTNVSNRIGNRFAWRFASGPRMSSPRTGTYVFKHHVLSPSAPHLGPKLSHLLGPNTAVL